MSSESRAAKGIDVEGLERELAAMWAATSAGQSEGAHRSVTRATALNLVVYTTPAEDCERLNRLLDEVVHEHPCRALVLLADRGAGEARLEARASTRCREFARGGKQLCGEQVTIEVGGPAVGRAASAVEPLLIPDVPVFLWWKDIPHDEDELFRRLAALADRVVLDSAACDHPHLDLLRLARMFDEARGRLRASDVNWGRLTSWRTLLASFWDVADYAPQLRRINRVAVEYHSSRVAPGEVTPQAWLMVGWLASRLGWRVEAAGTEPGQRAAHPEQGAGREQGTARVGLKAEDGRPIEVELREVEEAGECAGMLRRVVLSDAEGGAQFHVEYRRESAKLETGASIGGELRAGRVLAYEARSESRRLSAELGILSRDLIYEAAVVAAARMIEAARGGQTQGG